MIIINSTGFEILGDINLKLLQCGAASIDSSWHGTARSSVYSRLYYVSEGGFYIKTDSHTHRLEAGKWYLVPCGSSYEYYATEPSSHIFIHFNLTTARENDVFEKADGIMSLEPKICAPDEIARLSACESILDKLTLKNAIFGILLEFIRKYEVSIDTRSFSPCVASAMRFIREHLTASLTVSEIAAAAFVSKSTLEKHFRDELSRSVGEFVTGEIMFRAAQMVLAERSMRDISETFGFCDQFYFSRKFKAYFGMTPREYKRSWIRE